MKQFTLFFLIILTTGLYAQKAKDFFNSTKVPIDFVGLDLSQARMVGSEGFSDPAKIRDYYFGVWNGLLVAERDKYDIGAAFFKDEVEYHLEVTEQVNKTVDYIDLVTNSTPAPFTEADLQKMVKLYDTKGLSNTYGVSLIVHSFNKSEQRAYLYVVIFNTKTKRVLFSDRMSGSPRGFGLRNYWAGAIYDILKQIKKREFRHWRKEYR